MLPTVRACVCRLAVILIPMAGDGPLRRRLGTDGAAAVIIGPHRNRWLMSDDRFLETETADRTLCITLNNEASLNALTPTF